MEWCLCKICQICCFKCWKVMIKWIFEVFGMAREISISHTAWSAFVMVTFNRHLSCGKHDQIMIATTIVIFVKMETIKVIFDGSINEDIGIISTTKLLMPKVYGSVESCTCFVTWPPYIKMFRFSWYFFYLHLYWKVDYCSKYADFHWCKEEMSIPLLLMPIVNWPNRNIALRCPSMSF